MTGSKFWETIKEEYEHPNSETIALEEREVKKIEKISEYDSDKLFFTSDLHFYHKNILKYTERPCSNIDEMKEFLINNWNSKVPKDGHTFILGDMCFRKDPKELEEIIRRLNGMKYLVLGNHDYFTKDLYQIIGFKKAEHYMEIKTKSQQLIILSHYPMLTWNYVHRGSWMLHGHVHATYDFMIEERKKLREKNPFIGIKTMDVGIDCPECHFCPFSYRQIEEKMNELT